MAILPILHWPDPRLSERCQPVGKEDVSQLAADMLETMYAAPGRGLAAPQVGVLKRLFVMDVAWKTASPAPVVLINPELLWQSPERIEGSEGCLSIPGVTASVERHVSVRLAWTDLLGIRHEETLTGFAAICAQHEHDHLEGIVTFDRLTTAVRCDLESAFLTGQMP